MTQLHIRQFPCLKDNYGVLFHDPEGGTTASIDAPDAAVVAHQLAEAGWRLTHIFATHHHADHTAGIAALKSETGCQVIGPRGEAQRIPMIDREVAEPDAFAFGQLEVRVLDTPGHTIGHVSYWLPEARVAFVGDTLFAMGCGRVLEGTAEMMWASLEKLACLPAETMIYCGHEYTLANARFGLTIEPENVALRQRAHDVEAMRAAGKQTLPTRVGLELETNVFLRPQVDAIRERLGMRSAPDWRVFAEIRDRKNKF
ncbi:MAG: hydroxyacylglutathione hydrolase [Hyphomicrobium sp.]|jgi:hydroxyacylglutathione hydrolase